MFHEKPVYSKRERETEKDQGGRDFTRQGVNVKVKVGRNMKRQEGLSEPRICFI